MKCDLRLASALLILLYLTFLTACNPGGGERTLFVEGWESLPIKTYRPSDLPITVMPADEGYWFVGDTVSSFPECGPTPHTAEILMHNGSKALRLTSRENQSDGGCADNVFVWLIDASTVGPLIYNKGFSISINSATHISFEEEGELFDPGRAGGENCIVPPCYDNISLQLVDQRGNALVYVLQRYPNAEPNDSHPNYREIFLDPDVGIYDRNLFDDFSSIPTFSPADAKVVIIEFTVDEHGWAIIDDINIG